MPKNEKNPYEILKLLSDRQRVEILRELKHEDRLSFSDIWKKTGLQSGRLAFQLGKLKPLLRKTKEDQYALNTTGLKVLEALDYYEKILDIEKPRFYEATDGRTMVVREAKPEDYPSIVEVDCSWVEKWLKFPASKRFEVSYDELSSWERTITGGFWRDLTAYKAYVGMFLKEGGKIFVLEVDGKVVGFMELTFNEEPEPFGKFIETGEGGQTQVHKEFCGMGVGTALLEHLTNMAKNLGYKAVDFGGSDPETDEFDHFLKESRMRTVNLQTISVDSSEIERDDKGNLDELSESTTTTDLLASRPLTYQLQPVKFILGIEEGVIDILGKVQGFPKVRNSGLRIFRLNDKVTVVYLRTAIFPIQPNWANLFVWVSKDDEADIEFLEEVFGACGRLAKEIGMEKLRGYILEEHKEVFRQLGFSIGQKESYTRILL